MNKNNILLIFVLFFVLSFTKFIYASPSDRIEFYSDELSSLERQYFFNIDKNRNDLQTYYDGFLIASSITNKNEYLYYKDLLDQVRLRMFSYMEDYKDESDYDKGRILLKWLYSSGILKNYHLSATLATHLFDDGSYNCLSSTIIYTLLATELGLDVHAIFTSDHSFVVINTERGNIDVETTVEYGYDPGQKEIAEFQNQQRIVYVPKTNYRNRKSVDIDFLIASLYGNTISLVPSRNLDNLSAYKKGFYIAPKEEFFQKNIEISLNNRAIDQINNKNYEVAFDLLSAAVKFNSNSEMTRHNIVYYYQHQGISYLNERDYPSAIAIFEHALEQTNGDNSVKNNLKVAYYNYIVNEYNANRFENAKIILARATKRFPNDNDFIELQKSIN